MQADADGKLNGYRADNGELFKGFWSDGGGDEHVLGSLRASGFT